SDDESVLCHESYRRFRYLQLTKSGRSSHRSEYYQSKTETERKAQKSRGMIQFHRSRLQNCLCFQRSSWHSLQPLSSVFCNVPYPIADAIDSTKMCRAVVPARESINLTFSISSVPVPGIHWI